MPETEELSNDQIAKFQRIDAPYIYASSFHILPTSVDATIIFQRLHPGTVDNKLGAGVLETTAIVCVSLGALKDLHILLADQIARIEADRGEIVTDYVRRMKEEASKAGK